MQIEDQHICEISPPRPRAAGFFMGDHMIPSACPCCGWRANRGLPYTVDMNRNLIMHRLGAVKLSPVEAEVAEAISRSYPNPMHRDRIMALVWPNKEYVDLHGNMVSVYASKIKRRLSGTGLQIRNFHSRGYIIEEVPA